MNGELKQVLISTGWLSMIEITGDYGTAKVFHDEIDAVSKGQIETLMNSRIVEDAKVRFMPDFHAGAGSVIGTTMPMTHGRVVPNIIGVDIGCGVLGWKLDKPITDFAELDRVVRRRIPSGFKVHDKPQEFMLHRDFNSDICDVAERTGQEAEYVFQSIGTLGGGNHFIEVDEDEKGDQWVIVHTGSRNFGLKVALYWQGIAKETCKDEGPEALQYLEGANAKQYLHDMQVAQHFASLNRRTIMTRIFEAFGLESTQVRASVHNFISQNGMIRKGAISAHFGEEVIIPLNMADGTLLGTGLGNKDWNYSAPHGAGRTMSRRKAKETFTMEEFESKMKGVYSTSVRPDTLDESPMAYKSGGDITDRIAPTVKLTDILRPVYNFKA